jgi:Glycosyltransferase
MKTLFCHDGPLFKDKSGKYFHSSFTNKAFERYFCVADELEIVTRIEDISSLDKQNAMDELVLNNISITSCPDLASFTSLIRNYRLAYKIIEKSVKRSDFVVIRLGSVLGFICFDICKKYEKKHMIEVVSCAWDAYWNYSLKGKLIAPVAYIIMRSCVKRASYAIYVTSEFLQKRYPTKGKNIACSNVELNEVDDSILEKRKKKIYSNMNKKYVLGTAAGLDVKYKGQQYVIEAISILKKRGVNNVEYQLVGSGSGKFLKSEIDKKKVQDNVHILGQKKHEDIFGWMDNLDIYIQPSRQEGLPRSIIEAMSRGLPVLGANTAGIPELLPRECIFLNNVSEPRQIANMIEKLISDEGRLIAYAETNYRESNKYKREILQKRRTDFIERAFFDR